MENLKVIFIQIQLSVWLLLMIFLLVSFFDFVCELILGKRKLKDIDVEINDWIALIVYFIWTDNLFL